MKLLFVLRDIMSANMALPVILLAKEQGHNIAVLAEGQAVGICKKAGIKLRAEGNEKLDAFTNDEVFYTIQGFKPDAICIGCSSPINWELEFAHEARRQTVPVVAFSDIWGALSRLKGFKPDLGVVIDPLSTKIKCGDAVKFAIMGDPAELTARAVGFPDEGMKTHHEALIGIRTQGKKSLLVVGDSNELAQEICRVVAESIRMSENPEEYVVIPRLVHPKQAHLPEVEAIVAQAMNYFEGLRVEQFDAPTRARTDWLAAHCDITTTSYSTPGRIALHAGKCFASIQTPACQAEMERETKLPSYPLCNAGMVYKLEEPFPLDQIPWLLTTKLAKNWTKRSKFRPDVVLQAISELATR